MPMRVCVCVCVSRRAGHADIAHELHCFQQKIFSADKDCTWVCIAYFDCRSFILYFSLRLCVISIRCTLDSPFSAPLSIALAKRHFPCELTRFWWRNVFFRSSPKLVSAVKCTALHLITQLHDECVDDATELKHALTHTCLRYALDVMFSDTNVFTVWQ